MNHNPGRKGWSRRTYFGVIGIVLLLLLTTTPLFAADKGITVLPAAQGLNLVSTIGGDFLFQFKVPVNISKTGDLEANTGNPLMRVSCSVTHANDPNFNQTAGSGNSEFQLTNHAYNGTVTVNITAMNPGKLASNMELWRCVLLKKTSTGNWSLPILDQFDQPGSTLTQVGKL